MPLNINLDPLLNAVLEEVAEEIHGLIIDKIESKEWDWPRETVRKSGEIARSPRDIVDMGELWKSQGYHVIGNEIIFYNTAEHAAVVHEGADNRDYPGRPFMREVLEENDPREMIAERLGYKLDDYGYRDERGRFTKVDDDIRGVDYDTELGRFE